VRGTQCRPAVWFLTVEPGRENGQAPATNTGNEGNPDTRGAKGIKPWGGRGNDWGTGKWIITNIAFLNRCNMRCKTDGYLGRKTTRMRLRVNPD